MTRLIPTRDLAQATRFTRDQAEACGERLRKEYEESRRCFVIRVVDHYLVVLSDVASGPLWSGPWYVREEVAE